MPSGAVHNGVTVLSTVAVAGGLLALGTPGDVVIGIAVGQLAGLTMTPDMDVDRGNRTDTLVRAVAPPLEVLWDAYWWPYRKLFKHRGVSHTPIFGTLTRVLYTIYINPVGLALFWPAARSFALWWTVGLCISDTLHLLADLLVSSHKRKVRAHVDYGEFKRWHKKMSNLNTTRTSWLSICLRLLQKLS